MKVLILGNGAREHALAWSFSKSKRNSGLFCMPGNAGTADIAVNIDGDYRNGPSVVEAARKHGVNLVVIGPEAALAAGVADAVRTAGISAFGPGASAARLESSKAFAREFSNRAGIPSARTLRFTKQADFVAWLDAGRPGATAGATAGVRAGIKAMFGHGSPSSGGALNGAPLTGKIVLKKSGLAAGKGVLESGDDAELKAFAQMVLADDELLVEEFLVGYELSVFGLTDGKDYLTLPACADHKKALPDNQGLNTGGMGALCPVPSADRAMMERIDREIVAPTFRQMAAEGLGYRGVVFFGVMVCSDGPRLLEYNVRFGDPETQSLLPLLTSDICDMFETAASGSVLEARPEFENKSAVGITIAAAGYPGPYTTGLEVQGLPRDVDGVKIFHAGTMLGDDGVLRTGGGRCFTVVAVGDDYFSAHGTALEAARRVRFDGSWFRDDIGKKFFLE
ncbi:MAG: phosphoribosylglycinamide synthetase C domain-containing protein [Spirochaetota bacterium]